MMEAERVREREKKKKPDKLTTILQLKLKWKIFSFLVWEDEFDGAEMGRSSSELSNLNEDWDSGMKMEIGFIFLLIRKYTVYEKPK